jgi:hypothetical protein
MPTFREILDDDMANVILNEDEFAESVSYHDRGGDAGRPVTATRIQPYKRMFRQDPHHEIEADTVQFAFRKDATLGVVNPDERDFIRWNDRDWTFSKIVDQDFAGITLEFAAGRITQEGFPNRRML